MIPAKYYYDDATQDQWQQKKSSKEETKSNKKAKLDPNSKDFNNKKYSNLNAKEVMENKAKDAKPVKLPKALPKVSEGGEEDEEEEENYSNGDNISGNDDDDSNVEIPDMDVSDDEQPSFQNDSIQIEFDDEGNEVNRNEVNNNQDNEVNQEPKPQKNNNGKKELTEEENLKKQENLKNLREKLANKISNLREKRKAPGSKNGKAPKSRDQILDERKRKEELKRQELKRKREEIEDEDEEEDEEEEEEEEEDHEIDENNDSNGNVVFGNIVFQDGSKATSDLSKYRNDKSKKKGPANNDVKAHLLKLEKKKQKLAQMSPEERAKQIEKDKWQRVMNQAQGIKPKDDEKLLKKALKRKEKQKLRSEIEWKDRKQVVKDTMAAKSKKREENLKQRRENKGKKSKNQVKLKKFTGIVNKKKRAGFEGSAKSQKNKKK